MKVALATVLGVAPMVDPSPSRSTSAWGAQRLASVSATSPKEGSGRTMSIAVVVGNPKAGSRTLRVALAVTDTVVDRLGNPSDRLVVDLADLAPQLFDMTSQAVHDVLEAVRACNLLIVASPTYKATYTGLLKSLFDRYATDALSGTVAVAVMTGAAPIHALAPEVHLRPLLIELGATVPARGLYVTEQQFDDLDRVVGAWADSATPLIGRALTVPASSSAARQR
jgi:FMN reductase